jgi:GrpB-like predicted nucleotidyltransferase (UPF0157 family)
LSSADDPAALTNLDAKLDEVLVGGREPARLQVVDYDPAWPVRFGAERERLRVALGARARRIEHIGSTAVPGLAAKPIVDILVEIDRLDEDPGFCDSLQEAGYELRVREPDHRMFRTPARDVHVHFWLTGSDDIARHLVFRDWLRTHPEDRRLYERTKRELATRFWPDMNYYAEAKTPVIAEITARARSSGGL